MSLEDIKKRFEKRFVSDLFKLNSDNKLDLQKYVTMAYSDDVIEFIEEAYEAGKKEGEKEQEKDSQKFIEDMIERNKITLF